MLKESIDIFLEKPGVSQMGGEGKRRYFRLGKAWHKDQFINYINVTIVLYP